MSYISEKSNVPLAEVIEKAKVVEAIKQNDKEIKRMTKEIEDIPDYSPNSGIEDSNILEPRIYTNQINPEFKDYYDFETLLKYNNNLNTNDVLNCGDDYDFKTLLKYVNCYAKHYDNKSRKGVGKMFLGQNGQVKAIRKISDSTGFVERMDRLINEETFNNFFQYLTGNSDKILPGKITEDLKPFKDFFIYYTLRIMLVVILY